VDPGGDLSALCRDGEVLDLGYGVCRSLGGHAVFIDDPAKRHGIQMWGLLLLSRGGCGNEEQIEV
jgi:hypothetical protein